MAEIASIVSVIKYKYKPIITYTCIWKITLQGWFWLCRDIELCIVSATIV